MSSMRHEIRTLVIQALYEVDFAGNLNDKDVALSVFNRLAAEGSPALINNQFAETIISGVTSKLTELNEIIQRVAPDWPLSKLGVVEKNILRVGIFELLFGKTIDVPGRVAINEAIELGKSFVGEGGGKFINGVLGTVFRELDQDTESSTVVKKSRRVVKSTGGIVYYIDESSREICFAFVKDIFGKWTLSKGTLREGENIQTAIIRVIREELGLTVTIDEEIGFNSYVSHPPEGSLRKEVTYFLLRAKNREITLQKKDGITKAQWFTENKVKELNVYKDIQIMILDTIRKISSQVTHAIKEQSDR